MEITHDVAFATLQQFPFIPDQGDWVIALSDNTPIPPIIPQQLLGEEELPKVKEESLVLHEFEAILYMRMAASNPTWSATKPRTVFYQVNHNRQDQEDRNVERDDPRYEPVAPSVTVNSQGTDRIIPPKVAVDPSDPKLIAKLSFIKDDGWVVTIMKPQVISSLIRLAELISGRVCLATLLSVVDGRHSFSIKEGLDVVHQFDIIMRHDYGVGPKEKAMRLRLFGE